MKVYMSALALCLGLVGLTLLAQEKKDAQQEAPGAAKAAQSGDEVKAALKAYVEAFNKHDHKRLGAMWSETGVYVDRETGAKSEGRELIEKEFADLFKEQPAARLMATATDVRFIKPDVAQLEGEASVFFPNEEPGVTSFTAVMVKNGDKWLLDSVNETAVPQPASSRDALAELEWLVGNWQDDSKEALVGTQVRWSPNEAFLIRSFAAQIGEDEYEGTQVIGYDPAINQIRSWSFYSDGSFGDGTWSKNGDEWVVKGTHRLADGRLAEGTQVISPTDQNSFTVQMVGQAVEGEPSPSTDPIRVVRLADKPAGDKKPAASSKTITPKSAAGSAKGDSP